MTDIRISNIKKGDKFVIQNNKCRIDIKEFIGHGSAGIVEKSAGTIKLEPGDIIEFEHVAYLGSDPGPGVPWFKKTGKGRGGFWPNDWGTISTNDIKPLILNS